MLVAQKPQEAAWRPVMGAQVLFDPITRIMLRRARRAAIEALGIGSAETAETASAAEQMEELGDALSFALIMAGARDWRDVARQMLDEAGEPVLGEDRQPAFEELRFSADNLAATLADPLAFEAFDAAYVIPFVQMERTRAAPGNASAVSPNTTGATATPDTTTAGKPAAKTSAARNARTSSTKPKPKKKRPSGTS